jgi:hypothetical protein
LFYDSESEEEMEPLDKLDPLYLKTEDVEANLPLDEVIQILESLAHEGLSKVSYFPFHIFNDSLSYDAKSREVLDVLNPPCYDTNTDIIDIDEFIHVGRRKWDVLVSDIDPIYNIENHSQLLPSQLPQQITFDFEQSQQGDDVFTDAPQTPKDDLAPFPPDIFRSSRLPDPSGLNAGSADPRFRSGSGSGSAQKRPGSATSTVRQLEDTVPSKMKRIRKF